MPEREDQLRNKPDVSVVVPVYNAEQFVAAAIESVFAQSFSDWELIIIDDCSRDCTWQIIQEFASEERVRLLRNDKNLGQFPTHNRGAKAAQGRYIKFLHADDLLYPHCLEIMVSLMESYPMAGMGISGNAWPWCAPKLLQPKEVWSQFLLRQSSLMTKGPICSVFRRDAFQTVGGYDGRFDSSDVKMNLTIAMKYPVLVLPEGLAWYRTHEKQVSATMRANDTGQKEKIVWVRELLTDPNLPLDGEKKEAALGLVKRDFLLSLRHYVLRRQFSRAGKLWQASGLPIAALSGARKRINRSLIESDLPKRRMETNWDSFPGQPAPLTIRNGTKPVVSVIITSDEFSHSAVASLDSVFAQRFEDWELLIVGANLQEQLKRRVKVPKNATKIRFVDNLESKGKWDDYNLAAAEARGRYLKLLDAGDLLYPNCLQMMIPMMMACEPAMFGVSGACGPYRAGVALDPDASLDSELFGTPRFLESPSALIVDRGTFLSVSGFDRNYAPAERHLQLQLSRVGKVVLMPKGMIHYDVRNERTFFGADNWPLGWAQGYDWIIEWLCSIEHGLENEQLRLAIGNLLRFALQQCQRSEDPEFEKSRILGLAKKHRVAKRELEESPPFMKRGGSIEIEEYAKRSMLQRPDWVCFGGQTDC